MLTILTFIVPLAGALCLGWLFARGKTWGYTYKQVWDDTSQIWIEHVVEPD